MEKSDNRIVELVQNGEVEAYSEIIERYQKRIFNLMFRFCNSPGEAAEMTQEVFCKAYEKIDSYHNGRQFFSWIYTLAMNHGRDWVRQQHRNKNGLRAYTDNLVDTSPLFPNEILERKQEVNKVYAALAELPYEKREILLLRYQKDHSISEIAEIFQISISAAKMRIHRSLEILNQCLGGGKDSNE